MRPVLLEPVVRPGSAAASAAPIGGAARAALAYRVRPAARAAPGRTGPHLVKEVTVVILLRWLALPGPHLVKEVTDVGHDKSNYNVMGLTMTDVGHFGGGA